MTFDVKSRILLLNLLPKEGTFSTLKLLRTLKEELSFSEAENKVLKFKAQDNGRVNWDTDADSGKEIEIGKTMDTVVVDMFKDLDKKKKLREEHLDLYERFVE